MDETKRQELHSHSLKSWTYKKSTSHFLVKECDNLFDLEAMEVIASRSMPHTLACKENLKKKKNSLDGIIMNTLLL